MSKDTKQNEKKDFTDSSWFIFLVVLVAGLINVFIIK